MGFVLFQSVRYAATTNSSVVAHLIHPPPPAGQAHPTYFTEDILWPPTPLSWVKLWGTLSLSFFIHNGVLPIMKNQKNPQVGDDLVALNLVAVLS
jgi:hypothetical protein